MKTSESVKNIAPALLAAQKLMGGAKKDASNPYFKSKYADLGAVLEACKELLNDNGVTILQPHISNERGNFVETILLHSSGEWVSSETQIICAKQNDPQAQGSAITYARRYGLQSLTSMPAEDDDGNSATNRPTTTKTTTPATKTPPAVALAPTAAVQTPVETLAPAVATGDAAARPKPSFRKAAAPSAAPVTPSTNGVANGVAKKTNSSNVGW